MRRVAVTGVGVVSAIGLDLVEFESALRDGVCGIRPMELVDRQLLRFSVGAEIGRYRETDYFSEKEAALLDRFAQLAMVAAQQAVTNAGIEWTDRLRERTAIVTGTSMGGQKTVDDNLYELYKLGQTRFSPFIITRTMANAGASQISMRYGITGPAWTVSTACSSSNHAIGQAFWMVRNGTADCAITGGSEAVFHLGLLKAWEAMRVVAPDTCRPFSAERKGLVLGEGAAFLVLEPWESARQRGANIWGEIAGFGMSSDAHHITHPSPDGAAAAIRGALADAGMTPDDVAYINAHGTGTVANDATETAAIRQVFGRAANRVAVSSTKSLHGHTLGAAGAIEAAATLLAIDRGFVPPTLNYLGPDPECDLDVVPNTSRAMVVSAALSNSFAFGGLNAVLAFRHA